MGHYAQTEKEKQKMEIVNELDFGVLLPIAESHIEHSKDNENRLIGLANSDLSMKEKLDIVNSKNRFNELKAS